MGSNMCGRLVRWLYGMRGAALEWELECSEKLVDTAFTRGMWCPSFFHRSIDQARLVVHGDNFTFLSDPTALAEISGHIRCCWDLKLFGRMGNERGNIQNIDILNSLDGTQLALVSDRRQRDVVCSRMGIRTNTNSVAILCDDGDEWCYKVQECWCKSKIPQLGQPRPAVRCQPCL